MLRGWLMQFTIYVMQYTYFILHTVKEYQSFIS